MGKNKQTLGITFDKKENFSEWYTELIQKAELADYTKVSGCIVYRPASYEIWEKIREVFDKKIKKIGVKNAYFPLLIPKSLLTKEEEHIEGFAPEVAWVDYGGNTKLGERLAIRPTSETIIYDSYSKWIRSYKDLPLKLNQWCNVVRWEFKHATPFLRGREFLWQEGHTCFSNKKDALIEVFQILEFYKYICEEILAIKCEIGIKSMNEKFAGAEISSTIETFMPDGKVLQSGTSHHLGQTFSKSFDIKFENNKQQKEFAYQNSWGISTRLIGALIMSHSDNKGLVLPPKLAENKVVIIPILIKGKEEIVLKKCEELAEELKEFDIILDTSTNESAGFKFSKYELKGIPIRIEVGPRDVENKKVFVSRRDTIEKFELNENELNKEYIENLLDKIQKNLFEKSKNFVESKTKIVKTYEEFKVAIKNKDRVLVAWKEDKISEEKIKEDTGAKSSCIPIKYNKQLFSKFDLPKNFKKYEDLNLENEKCFYSGEKPTCFVFFAKSY